MIEGEINGKPYEIAIGDKGETLWQTVQVAEERDEVWEDWSLSMGETERVTGRGHLFADGFDPSKQGVLRLSPFAHNDNNPTDHTVGYGYFIEATGGTPETITHDASDSAAAQGSSVTIDDFTVASGTNRLLFAGISVQDPNDTGIIKNGTCTFGGVPMTLLTSKGDGSGGQASVGIFFLLSPLVSTGDVVFTSGLSNTDNLVLGVSSYTGVDQNNPFGSTSSNKGNDTTPTTATASATNEMVIDVVAAVHNASFTDDETQERWNTAQGTNVIGASSWEAGAANVTSSWTAGAGVRWAIVAVPLKQASTTGGQNHMFVADATKITKYTYDADEGLTDVTTTTIAGGVAGRPAKMNGKWYVPFGSGANARRLDDADTPTWADAGWTADHLATFQKGVQPTLARVNATTQNTVELNDDTSGNVGDTWTNESELVGDSSAKITDLVEAQGQLYVAKTDGLYAYGTEAESFPVIPFIDRGNLDPDNGRGSHAFGDIIFYPSNQGLWRYQIGRGALPVGVSTIRGLRRVPNINLNSSWPQDRRHAFVTHAGEWVYVQLNSLSWTTLLQMRLRREGDPEGHEWIINGIMEIPLSKGMGLDRNGRLWQKGASISDSFRDIRVIHLDAGGGTDVENRRGQNNESRSIYFDERNPGRPQDKVQLRHYTVELEGDWNVAATLALKVWRDNGTSAESVGSAITAGVTTANWAVGTNDTAFRFRPQLTVTTSFYNPKISQPDILRVIIGIRFPEIVRIVIPAKDAPGTTALDIEQNLRRLQNQGTVTFRRPGDTTATFSAEVFSVKDVMYATGKGFEHGLELQIRRFITA